jgi:hypothetical protein
MVSDSFPKIGHLQVEGHEVKKVLSQELQMGNMKDFQILYLYLLS